MPYELPDFGKWRRINCRSCQSANIMGLAGELKLVCNHCLGQLYSEDAVIEDAMRFTEHIIECSKTGRRVGDFSN